MKIFFLLIIAVILNLDRCFGQSTQYINTLTKADRENYELVIKQAQIVVNKCAPKKITHLVYVLLINKSNDTLKYWDYTCSSFIWDIDNNKNYDLNPPILFKSCGICNSNFPMVFELPPHQNKFLRVFVTKNNDSDKSGYKIGISLFRYKTPGDYTVYEQYLKDKNRVKLENSYVIWSMNTIK